MLPKLGGGFGTTFSGAPVLVVDADIRDRVFTHEYLGHALANNILATGFFKSVKKCVSDTTSTL